MFANPASTNDINGNRRISTSTGDLNAINQNQKMTFVPSKRTIQHHEYQNLVDDVTPSIVNGLRKRETSRQRHKSEHGTYDSIMPMPDNRYVDNNNNQQQQQHQQQMKRESNRTSGVAGTGTGAKGQQMVNGPVYRHFGDTNLMRNHNGKSPINSNRNLMNKSNSTTSLATTAICGGGGSSAGGDSSSSIYNSNRYRTRSIGQDIDQHSYSDAKMAADKLNNNNSNRNGIRSTTAMAATTDKFNPMASNPYITSNLTNDTGFSSMDADNSSTITPTNHNISKKTNKTNATNPNNNNYYSAFNQIRRMNYDVKNRIKMFDVVDRSAEYRPIVCHKNYKPRSDKRFVQTNFLCLIQTNTFMMSAAALLFLFPTFFFSAFSGIMFYVIRNGGNFISSFKFYSILSSRSISHHYGKAQNSAGSSSNVSSSNSNNSDGFNSLDSMENEIQHKNKNNQRRNRPTVPANGVSAPIKAKSSSKSAGDSLSYLGPFNFRQLLRPIQGPTNSLRKRKSGKV